MVSELRADDSQHHRHWMMETLTSSALSKRVCRTSRRHRQANQIMTIIQERPCERIGRFKSTSKASRVKRQNNTLYSRLILFNYESFASESPIRPQRLLLFGGLDSTAADAKKSSKAAVASLSCVIICIWATAETPISPRSPCPIMISVSPHSPSAMSH
jgi:hypothetical protein